MEGALPHRARLAPLVKPFGCPSGCLLDRMLFSLVLIICNTDSCPLRAQCVSL